MNTLPKSALLLFALSSFSHGADFWVSPVPIGNDTNAGTQSAPFATIQRAIDAVKGVDKSQPGSTVVTISQGTYPLSQTLSLDESAGGSPVHHVTYKAASGEDVWIRGGIPASGWVQVPGKPYYQVSRTQNEIRDLYVNGERRMRARTNTRITAMDWSWSLDGATRIGLLIDHSKLPAFQNPEQLELHMPSEWRDAYVPVQSVTETSGMWDLRSNRLDEVSRMQPTSAAPSLEKSFWVENALELLDQPGEWCFVRATKVLYYYPLNGENIGSVEVIVPVLEKLLDARGSSLATKIQNVSFEGIRFANTAWNQPSNEGWYNWQSSSLLRPSGGRVPAAIEVNNASNVTFSDCQIRNTAAAGIAMPNGVTDSNVTGNYFFDFGDSALTIANDSLGVIDAPGKEVPLNVSIADNLIVRAGSVFSGAPAISAFYVDGLVIDHNTIMTVPYSGISVGWGWEAVSQTCKNNRITNNKIVDFLQICKDGAGIYTLGNQPNSLVEGNYLSNARYGPGGLYFDQGSAYYTARNNVVENTPLWLHIWKDTIHDITLSSNWSTTGAQTQAGTNITYEAPVVVSDGNWPAAALAVMNSSGIRHAFNNFTSLIPVKSGVASEVVISGPPIINTPLIDPIVLSARLLSEARPFGVVGMRWSKKAGPGTVTFPSATESQTLASFSIPGTYIVECAATDLENRTSSSTVQIDVTPSPLGANLALGKPAEASTIYAPGYEASNGVDGNPDTIWHPQWDEAAWGKSWWIVDLGANVSIGRIEMDARKYNNQPDARCYFKFEGSADRAFTQPLLLGFQEELPFDNEGTWSYNIAPAVTCRYLRMIKTRTGLATVAELRVFDVAGKELHVTTISGMTTIHAGTLVLQNTYAIPGFTIESGATLELNVASGTQDSSTTSFSGTGTLRKTGAGGIIWGAGTAIFALGAGSWIDVQAGSFIGGSFGNENWTGNLSGLNVAGGATFSGVEANVRVDALTGSGTISSGFAGAGYVNFTFGVNGGSGLFAGTIADGNAPANIVKEGAGTQTLSGNSAYTGGTTINGGKLTASRSSLGTGAVVINNGGTLHADDQWVLCGANPYNVAERNIGTLTINAGGTLELDATNGFANGATNLYLNGGLVTGGPNNFRGDLFLYNGNEQITAGGAATSTIASVIGVTGNNNTITVDSGSTLNVTGVMKNSDWYGNGSTPGGFIKAGTGTLVLTQGNTYTGTTTVTGGTLLINGTLGATEVTVANSATLGGTGAIGGSVTVQSGGSLTPGGNGPGALTVGSATGSGRIAIQIDANAADQLTVTGNLDITNCTLDISVLTGGLTQPSYVIATYGNLTGSQFVAVTGLPSGYQNGYDTANKRILLFDQLAQSPRNLSAAGGIGRVILGWQPTVGASETNYQIERATVSGGSYTVVTSTATGNSFNDATVAAGTTYYYRVRVSVGGSVGPASNEASATTAAAGALPPPLTGISNIGGYGSPGVTYSGGTYTLAGSGAGTTGTADSGYFLYVPIVGDCTIVARVASLGGSNSARRAGVMMRQSLAANAMEMATLVGPTRIYNTYRTTTGGSTSSSNNGSATITAPRWVRIVRTGNSLRSAQSADGATWTQFTARTITMTGTVYVGLMVCSGDTTTTISSTFGNVTITGGRPTNLAATVALNQVKLTWTSVTGASSYKIKRATASGGTYTTIGTSTTASYTDNLTGSGAPSYYVVSAVANTTGESANSDEVIATPIVSTSASNQPTTLPATFASWIADQWPTLADPSPEGDPDSDGISNLMEYVLNGNPDASSMEILPTVSANEPTGILFTFTRREGSAIDTIQTFQYGSSLIDWTDIPITGTPGAEVTLGTPALGLQPVTVRIPESYATSGKLFCRLKVSAPPVQP